MSVPINLKIYHIVHVDRLPSIAEDGFLWCDARINARGRPGTTIGMSGIKERRRQNILNSRPHLHVGDCVPFYFCPRSVMLYMLHQANHSELDYQGGQDPIVHLVADFRASINWAEKNKKHWAFTLSNAGSNFFEDYCDLDKLHEIDWDAVKANQWQSCKDGKQAEFLLEDRFPWTLVERIGVYSDIVYRQALNALPDNGHRPCIDIEQTWYY